MGKNIPCNAVFSVSYCMYHHANPESFKDWRGSLLAHYFGDELIKRHGSIFGVSILHTSEAIIISNCARDIIWIG